MVDVKDLRPYVMRMFPSARRRLAKLPATRKALKADLRAMVKKIGPSMGKQHTGQTLHYAYMLWTHEFLFVLVKLIYITVKSWTGQRYNLKLRICLLKIWSTSTVKRMSDVCALLFT